MIQKTFGNEAMGRMQVKEWFRQLKEGRISVKSDEHTRRLSMSRNQEMTVCSIMLGNWRTITELSDELGLSSDSILSILTEDLGMKYFSEKFSQNCQQSSPTLSRTSWLNIRSRKGCSPPVHRTWSYDSFLFQDMIMLLKGNRLQDTQEINRNATMQLLATPNS
jgi:hypothetical protein